MFSAGGLEDKTLPWHVLPGAEENIVEVEPVPELQDVAVPLAPDRGHLLGVTEKAGVGFFPAEVKQVGCHVQGNG